VGQVRERLLAEVKPDGFNIGFNDGLAAGQTVSHAHVHVIPRFRGDMDDPRGGVRHVIPSHGNYLRQVDLLGVHSNVDLTSGTKRATFCAACSQIFAARSFCSGGGKSSGQFARK